jgi:DNA recombination protein RmuC
MESNGVVVALALLVIVLVVVLVFLIRVVLSIQATLAANPTAPISTGIVAVQSEQARVAEELGRAASALGMLQNVQQNFDAALRTLAGQAAVRAEADTQSRELLRRLELVIAGSFHKGAAGENLLSEVLSILPPGMLERNLRVAGGVVEFAIRLPGGKFIPIDSKWPGAQLLERLAHESDTTRRAQLVRELESQVSAKAEEVGKYLDPERTLLLGVAALPDAVYQVCRSVHAQAYKRGVILLPYSLAIPYVLSLFVLIARFGGALDTSRVRTSLAKIDETLHQLEESLEGHMSRGLTMLSNAVQNQRSGIAECRSIVAALRARDEATTLVKE